MELNLLVLFTLLSSFHSVLTFIHKGKLTKEAHPRFSEVVRWENVGYCMTLGVTLIGCKTMQRAKSNVLKNLQERVALYSSNWMFAAALTAGVCLLQVDEGPCRGQIERFYYNTITQKCETFYYGGCIGNANNFKSYQECQKTCFRIPSEFLDEIGCA